MKYSWKKWIFAVSAMALCIPMTSCSNISLSAEKSPGEQKRTFEETAFSNPPTEYRPLPIMHSGVDKGIILKLKELGYGGLVTNVSFQEYLRNEELWEDFVENTHYLIEDQGLKMWIYDELHYPSGAAGGLVLKDHPEWQARGIVCRTAVAEKPGKLSIEKPYGHDKVISAAAYKGTTLDTLEPGTKVDLTSFVDDKGNLSWEAPEKGWMAVCIYAKNFYEGTHAANNWAEFRRYINLLDAEPVQKFIEVTYQQYYDRVGKYFGKGIEAFFTDEPSLMGTYFPDAPPGKPPVKDELDPKIPLYPAANFGDRFLEDFQSRRGYDPTGSLPMLFGGNSEEAQKFRWDYYRTLSERVAENYTGQIGKFCEDKGVAMSGHLLLEEDIFMHPVFEGNYLQIYKNMQYPGIDLLTSHPQTALQWAATTAKFASSAAHYDRRKHVMSEVSDAFDSNKGTVEQRIGAVAVQYALGVDHFNSYYPVQAMSEEENRLFTNTIGRMRYMVDGGKHVARIAVYYPIEGVWTQTLPPESLWTYNNAVKIVSDNFKELSLELLGKQLDYDYIDSINLNGCKIKDGKIRTPGDEQYSVLVVPQTPALDSKAIDMMWRAAESGVKIVIQGNKKVLTEKGADEEKASQQYAKLLQHPNTVVCSSIYDIASTVETFKVRDIRLKKDNAQIVYTKKQYKNSSVYMLVNTGDEEAALDVTINETGSRLRLWDPFTGKAQEATGSVNKESHTTQLNVKINAEHAIFITVEE